MNIMMLLEMASGGFGERVALGSQADGRTYGELFQQAGRAAALFSGSGAGHVGLVDESSPALPLALFGSAWAGLPFVPLNYRLTDEELATLAAEIAPSLTICTSDTANRLGGVNRAQLLDRQDFLDHLGRGSTDTALDGPPAWSDDGEDIAILLYTSGTTGTPKAAILRQKHLVSYIIGSVEFMAAGEDEATLISVPPYHVAGMAAILSAIYAGRRIVQLPAFDAAEWVDLARREGVTHAMVVPTMLARIVDHLDTTSSTIPTLRSLSYGGGKMPAPVIAQALDLLPQTNFVNAYGLTETSSTIAVLGPDEHREAHASTDPNVQRRLGSAGRPLPGVEVSVRDDAGEPVETGTSGEIWVRGEQVSGEYVGVATRVTADGWFPTRDGGWFDDSGFLFVEGRIDDIIIRGGENISPGEIEAALLAHECVADVAALGLPDRQWGERVACVVVLKTGRDASAEDLCEFVKAGLRSSRTPEVIEFRAELPYNETGKLLRRQLRDELAHLGDEG
jgi:acyl-CoA synthetase (AMP-forming)/AMP-acid ligase II